MTPLLQQLLVFIGVVAGIVAALALLYSVLVFAMIRGISRLEDRRESPEQKTPRPPRSWDFFCLLTLSCLLSAAPSHAYVFGFSDDLNAAIARGDDRFALGGALAPPSLPAPPPTPPVITDGPRASVPEGSTLWLLTLGLLCCGGVLRRKDGCV